MPLKEAAWLYCVSFYHKGEEGEMAGRRGSGSDIKGAFTMIPLHIIEGPIWKLLTPAERSVFFEMRAQWQRQTRRDYSAPFTAPYDELTCAPATASKAIKRLCLRTSCHRMPPFTSPVASRL